MDPYLRPILYSSGIALLINMFAILPFKGSPLISFFLAGILAVYFFKKEIKDEFREIKSFDVLVLGIGTGVIIGAALTAVIVSKLQDIDMQKAAIEYINQQMKMNSKGEFKFIEELGPSFYVISAIVNLFMCCIICLFGSFATLPFVNKNKK